MRKSPLRKKKTINNGYSLLELLIVLAILSIIAGVAYPNYATYIKEARRSDAHLALMSGVQFMERCRSSNYSYETCTLPDSLELSDEGNYAISVEATASTFTLTATAQASQAHDSECATLTMDDKSTTGFTGAGPCW